MIKVLSEKDTPDHVKKMSAGRKVRHAVAFWGSGAVERIGLDGATGGKIICNLQSGCTNPNEILKLLPDFEVKTHGKLHGKLYKVAGMAVVGSSNASLNGLAIEGETQGWREINLATDDEEALRDLDRRFNKLWAEAKAVDEDVVEEYRPVWKRKQASAPPPPGGSLLEAIRKRPDFFANQPIYFTVSTENVSKPTRDKIDEMVAEGDLGERPKTDRYWHFVDWDPFPKNAWLLDVTVIRKPRYNGIARTFDKPCKIKVDGSLAQLAFRRPAIEIGSETFRVDKEDATLLAGKAKAILAATEDGEGGILPLSDVMGILGIR